MRNTILDNTGEVRIYLDDITDSEGKIDISFLNDLDDRGIRVKLSPGKSPFTVDNG